MVDKFEVFRGPAGAVGAALFQTRRAGLLIVKTIETSMASRIIKKLRSYLNLSQQLTKERDLAEIRQFVALIGAETDGREIEVDEDAIARFEEALTRQNFSPLDVEANVKMLRDRTRWASLASRVEQLRSEAAEAEQLVIQFGVDEAERHRQALLELERKREAARLKLSEHVRALEAEGDLRASAGPVANQEALQQELKRLVPRIERVRERLDASDRDGGNAESPAVWGSVNRRPARLARQVREMLAQKNKSYSQERRLELERTLRAAEAAVVASETELRELESRHAEVISLMNPSEDSWRDPENFTLKRHSVDADEQRKIHARRFGMDQHNRGLSISSS